MVCKTAGFKTIATSSSVPHLATTHKCCRMLVHQTLVLLHFWRGSPRLRFTTSTINRRFDLEIIKKEKSPGPHNDDEGPGSLDDYQEQAWAKARCACHMSIRGALHTLFREDHRVGYSPVLLEPENGDGDRKLLRVHPTHLVETLLTSEMAQAVVFNPTVPEVAEVYVRHPKTKEKWVVKLPLDSVLEGVRLECHPQG